MNFDPTSLSNFMLILVTWGALFLAALWLSLIIWTFRDIRARARDPLGRILAVLVVAVLFLPGIVVYLILRPRHTLEDEYQRTADLHRLQRDLVVAGCAGRPRAADDGRNPIGSSAQTATPNSRNPATTAAS